MKTILRRFSAAAALLAAMLAAPAAFATPTIFITSPASGSTVASVVTPAGLTITATATATTTPAGVVISSVQFFADGVSIGTAGGTSPFSVNWVPTTAGTHTITATVTDNSIPNTGTSPTSNSATATSIITLTTVRTATVAAPANNSTYVQGAEIFFRANAALSDAVVSKIDFFLDASVVPFATKTQAPFNVPFALSLANGFTVGTHTIVATASSPGGGISVSSAATAITIAASVVGNVAPVVTLTAPLTGATLPVNQNVTIATTATDSDGFIPSTAGGGVTFYADGDPIGSALTPPFSITWKPTVSKTYVLRAQAIDDRGAITLSADPPTVSVTVVDATVPATVSLTSPNAGANVGLGATVPVAATATASTGGTVTRVDFFAGTTFIASDNSSPFTVNWNPATTGAVSLTAKVTDSNGASVTSSAVSVTVTAAAPTIALTAPTNGAIVPLGTSIPLTASATGNNGASVNRVDFLANGVAIPNGTSLVGPSFSINWTPTAAGIIAITARATDSNGTSTTSSVVNVNVTAPTVVLTAPVAGSAVTTGTSVALTATAAGSATISQVEFFAGATSVGIDSIGTGSTYTVNWTPTITGNISLTAKVTDSHGAVITSSAVSVVAAASPPTVAMTAPSSGTTLGINSPVSLTATATAGGSATVTRVDFLVGGANVGTALVPSSGSTFGVTWTPTAAGVAALTARVTDSNGTTVTSSVVNVTVAAATVALTTPTAGSTATVGSSVALTATASAVGSATVTKVDFLAGTTVVGTATTSPYTVNWIPTAAATVVLTARVTDSNNAVATSAGVSVVVSANTGPAVALSLSPNTAAAAGSATLPYGAIRNVLAAVTPASGTAIVKVAFFVDGNPASGASVKTAAPYSYRYVAPSVAGSHIFSAVATDNAGNTGSAQLTFNVVSAVGSPPTITLLAPTNGATVVPNIAIGLAAAALANGGTIASVQFFANGSPAGINGGNALTAAPFVSSFSPPQPGTYVIDAVATDDRGNTAVSNSVTVTAAYATPTVAITSPTSVSTIRVTPNIPLTIAATATPGTGATVLLVEFLIDGVQVGARSSPTTGTTYTAAWTPTTAQLGLHTLTARVTDSNSLTTTSAPAVNLNVANIVGTPPTVTISAPTGTAATNIQSLSTVNLVANAFATGSNNSLTSVEFFLNDTSIGTATREQATNLWRLAYNFGNYDFSVITPTTPDVNGNTRYPLALYAIAKDTNLNQTISTTTNLIITQSTSAAPSVTLQAAGVTTVTQNTPVPLLAAPSDPDGTVTSMQLFSNGVASGSATPNPGAQVAVTFTPPAAGRYNLYVVATDDTGNVGVSSPSIVITANPLAAPSTTLTKPSDDATVTNVGAFVFLEATASSSDATQSPTVTFVATGSGGARTNIVNVQRVGTTTTYRATWVPTVADTYTVSSSATIGTVTATSPVSHRVVVTNVSGIAPIVSIAGGFPTSVTTASTANFTATASDGDGAVVSVEFFLNRSSIGFATRDQLNNTWRFTASFSNLIAGSYELVALARDNTGNLTASNTGTVAVTAATASTRPSITVFANPSSVAVGQSIVLTASASSVTGVVTGIQYFANATFLAGRTTPGAYQFTWTNATSGTYNIYAVATDSAGNTSVSPSIQVNVRVFNPVADNDAFVLQSYADVANNNSPNLILASAYSAQLAAGTLTRGQLISTLSNDAGFAGPINILGAYYVLMGQWPTVTNYTNLLASFRNNLAGACGSILASPEYIAKFPEHVTPTVTLLENPLSVIPATAFEARLWSNAGLAPPSAAADVAFRNNPTAIATLGRGYNVAGLNTALAEFITNTNSTNAPLNKIVRAAALYYQLDKPPLETSTDDIAARLAALSKLADIPAIAEAVLQDQLYLYRYVTITTQPQSTTVAAGANATFNIVAVGAPPLAYQWLFNGSPIFGATSNALTVTAVNTTKTGAYSVVVTNSIGTATSQIAVLGIATTSKFIGPSTEVASNVHLANGNTYDQVLLQGDSTTITAEGSKVTRLSYVDLSDDIVQVEFSGAGTLSIMLDNASGPATPVNYNQPEVAYMKGHAGIVVSGANETTNVSIFSVGRMTAGNQSLFKSGVNYDGVADLGYVIILSANGKFGGLRTANASYFATSGFAGVYAPGVQFAGPVFVGDVSAADDATPVLLLGSSGETRITGGDLLQMNGQPVRVSGISQLKFTDGTTSNGALLPAQVNQARLEQNDADVTDQLVVNPSSP